MHGNYSRKASVSDLAADSAGNADVFTGPNDPANLSDTISLVSPTGQLLKQVYFSFDT